MNPSTESSSKIIPAAHYTREMSAHQHCPIQSLPNELLDAIFQQLSHMELLHCSQVSSHWFDLVSERLLRTQSCSLVKDQLTCQQFNSNDKLTRQLILHNVKLWDLLDKHKVQQLGSVYFLADHCTGEDVRGMSKVLGVCQYLTHVTLHTRQALHIQDLEELLHNLNQVKTLCLMVEQLSEEGRNHILEFFTDVYYFYDEVVLQVMNPCNEVIVICSDKASLHPHVHNQFSKVVFGHVSPPIVQTVLNTSTNIKHLEILGRENSEETLAILSTTPHCFEHMTLDNFSSTNQAWGTFFKRLNDNGQVLKELNLSQCFNITSGDLLEFDTLYLNKLEIDLCNSPKITSIEKFLHYCLSHIFKLKISFIYNENILNNFIDIFHTFRDSEECFTKRVDIDILRVNHCSEEISNKIQEFKIKLDHLADKCFISLNVEENFHRVSQNM